MNDKNLRWRPSNVVIYVTMFLKLHCFPTITCQLVSMLLISCCVVEPNILHNSFNKRLRIFFVLHKIFLLFFFKFIWETRKNGTMIQTLFSQICALTTYCVCIKKFRCLKTRKDTNYSCFEYLSWISRKPEFSLGKGILILRKLNANNEFNLQGVPENMKHIRFFTSPYIK